MSDAASWGEVEEDVMECWECNGDGFFWSPTDDLGCCGEDGWCTCGHCYQQRCETCEGRGALRAPT